MLFGTQSLNIEDATASPILDAFATTPDTRTYEPLAESIAMTMNPGKAASRVLAMDGPASAAIPEREWVAVHGAGSLARHRAYLARLGTTIPMLAARAVGKRR